MLCKCGWDFDHFDQFDQNHAFSNHNPKRMTIGFVLRELITICEICKNEKQNEWDFIPCLFSSLQKRKERKDCQIHFHLSTNNFHSFSLIQYHQNNHNQSQWEEEKVKMNIINNHRTSRKPHRLTRAWREGKQTTLTQLPAFPAFCNYLNTRSPPMRIDTPQVTSADRDLSHWCFRR